MAKFPQYWQVLPLEKCVDILDNQRVPVNADERSKRQGDVPYYGATGQVGWIDDFLFDEELILLGEDGAPFFDNDKNVAFLIRGKSWVNNHAHVLRARADVTCNSFVLHYLNYFDYTGFVGGTTRLKLTQGRLKEIPFPVPPLPEQKRIVAKLDKLFAHLDQLKARLERIPELLKQFRQAVLTQAVTGKLVGKQISLRQMRIDELTDFIGSGITPKGGKDNYLKEGVPFIRSMNVYPDGLHLEDIAFISKEMHDQMERTKVRDGDVLLNITGASIGRATYVPVGFGEANVNQHVCILRCNKNVIPQFLSIYLNSKQGQSYIMETQTGMTRQGLNYSQIRAMQVPIVKVEDQREIVARVESLLLVVDRIEASYKALRDTIDQLPQTILSKAFRGELASAEKEVAGYSEEIGKLGIAAEP